MWYLVFFIYISVFSIYLFPFFGNNHTRVTYGTWYGKGIATDMVEYLFRGFNFSILLCAVCFFVHTHHGLFFFRFLWLFFYS